MLYNKDKEYTLKYIDINGQQQELKYTPEKDMSVPEIITMLQNKDKNFYKLLKESKFDKISKEIFNKGKQDGMTKSDADAIAASIGRKKYGKKKFSKMTEKGKKTEDTEKDKVRFDEGELKDKGAKVRQAFKDFWNSKISGKDLEDIKRQSKLSQGELDSIQYDASREVDNKMEAKNKDVKGIFDKKDVKAYLQDIGRVVANTIQQTAKNVNIEIPTNGTLMSNNTVIQYVLPVSRFTGDLIDLGEEIGKNLKAVLESGRVKEVKCVPEHRKNKQVLILSIIGPNIAKVIGESVDKELKHPELNNNIKDFYTSSFSGDDLGDNINNSVTFLQLYRALKNKKDIYKLLGTEDSTVRERVFRELARILNTDYMYVYNIWQYGVVDGQPNVIKEDKEKIGKVMNKMKKVEAENNNGTLSVDLNTGVLPVVDVDMYSMSDMINDYNVSQEELDEIVMDNAPEFVQDTVSDVLPGATIKATSVYHPQQYNFGEDELEFTLTCDRGSFETLKEQTVQNSSFASFLKKNYSSRSGFISSMADNIDDFNTQDEWKQVVQVIMFNVPENVIQYNNENFVDKFIDTLGANYTLIDDEDDLFESKTTENSEADKLIKDYFNYKMDLPTLHKKLRQLFGNMKDAVEYLHDNETRVKNMKENKLQEDNEEEMEDVDSEGEGEDTTELQQEMEEVVTELDNVTEEETLGLEVTVGTIDVLIKDEEAAIDGYNSFLNQIKNTIPETVYNTIEEQLQEVIQDEEDHINILNTIKENLNTTEAPIEENKEIVLTENVTVEDIYNELDIDIDSPAAEYEWDTVQEYLDSNPGITLEQAVKDIKEYFETGML